MNSRVKASAQRHITALLESYIKARRTANRRILTGPGRYSLYTVWRPVMRGSRSDRPGYIKPIQIGSTANLTQINQGGRL